MASISETCALVNGRALFEAQLNEAVQNLCRTIGARLTAALAAIVSHIVSHGHYVRRIKVAEQLVIVEKHQTDRV